MANQDKFYFETESNAFFDRWSTSSLAADAGKGKLRPSKKEIFDQLANNVKVNNLKVLEVGCFIGDLLGHLKANHTCEVHGIESSAKACKYAKENFGVEVENATFVQSKFFSVAKENQNHFDLIICDDVLSWMSRDLILPSLGVMDWMLKPGGSIFLRDFSPTFGFAFENHHWKGQDIYNFKQPAGHRQFFLSTGKYLEKSTFVRTDAKYQEVKTSRPDAMTWSDSILTKMEQTLHPVANL